MNLPFNNRPNIEDFWKGRGAKPPQNPVEKQRTFDWGQKWSNKIYRYLNGFKTELFTRGFSNFRRTLHFRAVLGGKFGHLGLFGAILTQNSPILAQIGQNRPKITPNRAQIFVGGRPSLRASPTKISAHSGGSRCPFLHFLGLKNWYLGVKKAQKIAQLWPKFTP